MRWIPLSMCCAALGCGSSGSGEEPGSAGGSAGAATGGAAGAAGGPGAGAGGVAGAGAGSGSGGVAGAGGASGAGGVGGSSGTAGGAGFSGASGGPSSGALRFFENAPTEHDYTRHTDLPPGFGSAEFTLEVWILPDDGFPVGSTAGSGQLRNWSDADVMPYDSGSWWFEGNFLLDGHNNSSAFEDGTFSLQWYGSGRLRWLFGDGVSAGPGGHWSVGAFPASDTPSLLDGRWHLVSVVRRFTGNSGADLELWIDGALVDTERTTERTDVRATYWDSWTGFGAEQAGWFWGAEKQAAIGVLDQYEDYKGLLGELRFWNVARTAADLTGAPAESLTGSEPGLSGWFTFDEGSGPLACDRLDPNRCMSLVDMKPGHWVTD